MTLIIGTYQSHCKGEHNESEKKSHGAYANLAVFFLTYKVVQFK